MKHAFLRISDFGLRISSAAALSSLLSLCLLAALAGCAVGPDYKRPVVDTPPSYRPASDATLPCGHEHLC